MADQPQVPLAVRLIVAERVLEEKDGTITAVRLVDRMELTIQRVLGDGPEVPPDLPIEAQAHLAVLLRQLDGPPSHHTLKLMILGPGGVVLSASQAIEVPLAVDKGANFISPVSFPVPASGGYAVHLVVDDQLLDVWPIEVLRRVPEMPAGPSPSPSRPAQD